MRTTAPTYPLHGTRRGCIMETPLVRWLVVEREQAGLARLGRAEGRLGPGDAVVQDWAGEWMGAVAVVSYSFLLFNLRYDC
jgi:hypothetical protein